jgi:hypothetical protein
MEEWKYGSKNRPGHLSLIQWSGRYMFPAGNRLISREQFFFFGNFILYPVYNPVINK